MKRWLFLMLLLPQCTGCMGYVYPTLVYTPEVVVPNEDISAHAFRVDIDKTECKGAPTTTEYTLTKITLDQRGIVPSQLEVAPVSGIYNPFCLEGAKEREHYDYTLTVRLYRPGYQTLEVKAWDKSHPLLWSAAPDLLAQEKAIDDLLADPEAPIKPSPGGPGGMQPAFNPITTWWEMKDQKSPRLGLQPGAVSVSQRKALVFAADEYQRLSISPNAVAPANQLVRERLQKKAIWLRRYAEQTPVP